LQRGEREVHGRVPAVGEHEGAQVENVLAARLLPRLPGRFMRRPTSVFYNRKRRYSALGYLSPAEYERAAEAKRLAA